MTSKRYHFCCFHLFWRGKCFPLSSQANFYCTKICSKFAVTHPKVFLWLSANKYHFAIKCDRTMAKTQFKAILIIFIYGYQNLTCTSLFVADRGFCCFAIADVSITKARSCSRTSIARNTAW